MTVLASYPDIEAALVDLVPGAVEGLQAGTVTPADLEAQLPFARIRRHGGTDDGITDRPRVTVDYIAGTRADAWTGARTVQQYLTQLGGLKTGAVVIDRVTTDTGPQEIPWSGNTTTVRRVAVSYALSARR